MISVNPGEAGSAAPAPLPYASSTKFDPKAVMPQRYLFDVQRTAGGKVHTLALHGTVSDEFSVNLANRAAPTSEAEKEYLHRFLQGEQYKYVGDAAPMTIATWRLRRGSWVLRGCARRCSAGGVTRISQRW